jgi:signal transduction histidine kinase
MADDSRGDSINAATLELLERRIADRVTEQARKRVISYYAVVGTTLAGVLGLLGWSVVGWVEREAKTVIHQQITSMTAQVDKVSHDVAGLQQQVNMNLQVLDALGKRAGRTLDNVEDTLKSFEPKSRKLEQVIIDIDELETRIRPIRGAGELADQNRADLERVSRELNTLAQQVKELVGMAQRAPTGSAGGTSGVYNDLAAATEQVAAGSANIAREIAASRATTTVYIQFSGYGREAVDQLRTVLAGAGFTVPAAERTSAATSLFEVRYFHDSDKAAADRLAQIITEAAKKVIPGEPRTAKVVDMTSYPSTKPKPATVELWYGPRA